MYMGAEGRSLMAVLSFSSSVTSHSALAPNPPTQKLLSLTFLD